MKVRCSSPGLFQFNDEIFIFFTSQILDLMATTALVERDLKEMEKHALKKNC